METNKVTHASYNTFVMIFVGDRVYNNLSPKDEFIVEEIEQEGDNFYINGWSINHFSKCKNQPSMKNQHNKIKQYQQKYNIVSK